MARDITPMAQNFSGGQASGGVMGGLGDLFEDRGFLKFLAGVGTELDPQGLGGMLGRPTSKWIERRQQGEAMNQIMGRNRNTINQLMQALAGNTNVTKLKFDEKGGIEIGGGAPKEGGQLEQHDFGFGTDYEDLDTLESSLDSLLQQYSSVGR